MTRPTFADPLALMAVHAFVDELLMPKPGAFGTPESRRKARIGIYKDIGRDKGRKR
jgi:hypothetical protein